MLSPGQIAAAGLLLIIFGITSAASFFLVVGALLTGQLKYASRVVHAMDCLLAAELNYSGRETVSKECGRQHDKTTFCRRICKWLDWADQGHCDREGGALPGPEAQGDAEWR